MGKLTIHGTIDVAQFWPSGRSDADTTSIELDLNDQAFFYEPDGAAQPSPTNAFEGAEVRVKGQGSKEVIRTLKTTGQRKITIRLQGVDAPELHLRATPAVRTKDMTNAQAAKWEEVKGEYRQLQAESATVALGTFLSSAGGTVQARFETLVDEPNDAIDAYGRFVGDLIVPAGRNQGDVSVNRWLISEGWGIVAFYSSMKDYEIEQLRTLSRAAKKKNARRHYDPGAKFDHDLRYRTKPKNASPASMIDADADEGGFVVPKLFRRLAQFATNKKAGFVEGSFQQYLEDKAEGCFDTDDFLENGVTSATVARLHEKTKAGVLQVDPEALVFQESKAKLVDQNGDPPTW